MASTINGTSTGSGGLISTGDDSGILNIQTNETTAITVDASQIVTLSSASNPSLIVNRTASTGDAGLSFQSTGTGVSSLTGLYGGGLRFGTGSGDTERMRIDSSGNLLVGRTSLYAQEKLSVTQTTDGQVAMIINNFATFTGTNCNLRSTRNTTNGSYRFLQCSRDGIADVLYIYDSGNVVNANNSYGAISDVKLKENIVDATPKLANLMQVKVRNYNLKSDPTHKQLGVVAQELEQVFPAMIEETIDRDAENNDLGTTTKSVKYSVFIPMLIKSIQELSKH
jgi:hypothetical protein